MPDRAAGLAAEIGHHIPRGGEADPEHLRLGGLVGEFVERAGQRLGALRQKLDLTRRGVVPGVGRHRPRRIRLPAPNGELRLGLVLAGHLEGQIEGRLGRAAGRTDEFVAHDLDDRLAAARGHRHVDGHTALLAQCVRLPA